MPRIPLVSPSVHHALIAQVAHRAALNLDEQVMSLLVYGDNGPAFSLVPGFHAAGDTDTVRELRVLASMTSAKLREI
jgi:hypothetical protein